MAYGAIQTITLTTIADGSGTEYFTGGYGFIESIAYTKTDYDNGIDFVISGEDSGTVFWTGTDVNASASIRPRAATHSTAGVAALYAAAGSAVLDRIFVGGERVKVVVSSGGNVKTGAFTLVFGG